MAIITFLGEGVGLLLLIGVLVALLVGLAFIIRGSSKKERTGRILFPVFFLELTLLCVILLLGFRQGGGGEVGPRIVPALWLAGMTGLSILLLVRALTGAEEKDPPWGKIGRVGVVVAMTIAYLVLMRYIGYSITTVAYVITCMFYLGYRKWKVMVSVATVWVVVAYFAFYRLLYVPLPRGLLIERIFG